MSDKTFNNLYAEYIRLTNTGSLKQANLKLVEIIGLMWDRIRLNEPDDVSDDLLSDEDLELILTGDLDTDIEVHLEPKGDGPLTISTGDLDIAPPAGAAAPEIDTDVIDAEADPEPSEDVLPFDGAPVSEEPPEDATVVAEVSTATTEADAAGTVEDTEADEATEDADTPKRRSPRKKAA